jgi:hypothetical protein
MNYDVIDFLSSFIFKLNSIRIIMIWPSQLDRLKNNLDYL